MKKKSLTKNSFFNIIYKGFTALFPLVTTSYISRVLLPEGVGKVSYANTVVLYFVTLASLGIPNYGVKLIASNSQSKEKISKSFYELWLLNAMSTLIFLIIYYLIIFMTDLFYEKQKLMSIMGILLIFNFINIDWFYQGIEEYVYIAIRSIVIKIISFIAMLLFVKSKNDYNIYALILVLASAGNYIFNFINMRKYVKKPDVKLEIKKHIKPVLVLLATAIATEIYTMLDTIMLEKFHGDESVGYYANSVKIVRMIYTVTIAMVATFYPRISKFFSEKRYEEINKLVSFGVEIVLVLSIPFTIGLFTTAEYIVPILLGNAFSQSVNILKILSCLIIIFSIAYMLGHIMLMSTGNENHILRATIGGAFTNFILNIILIPKFAGNGAAIASVCAEIIVTIVLLFYSRKLYVLHISKRFIISAIVSAASLLFAIQLIKRVTPISLFGYGVIVTISGCIYFLMLFILKNELISELKKILKKEAI